MRGTRLHPLTAGGTAMRREHREPEATSRDPPPCVGLSRDVGSAHPGAGSPTCPRLCQQHLSSPAMPAGRRVRSHPVQLCHTGLTGAFLDYGPII